jgi:hypothetical protein
MSMECGYGEQTVFGRFVFDYIYFPSVIVARLDIDLFLVAWFFIFCLVFTEPAYLFVYFSVGVFFS